MNRFTKAALALAAMVSLLFVGWQVSPTAAQATGTFRAVSPALVNTIASVQGCSSNGLCFYNTGSDTTPMLDWDGADHNNGACFPFGSSIGGRTSYVINSTSHQWKVYTNTSCSGSAGPLYANTSGAMTGVWNNSIWGLKY